MVSLLYQRALNPLEANPFVVRVRVRNGRTELLVPNAMDFIVVDGEHPIDVAITHAAPSGPIFVEVRRVTNAAD